MPPRRPLPDLCLISVFKMLTPNEQLVASKMSSRCAVLVRAANRTVKTLVVTWNYVELLILKDTINSFSLASKPNMKLLMDIPGETFPDYPMTTRLSKWNILQLDQLRLIYTAIIEQIVTIFSAVTELKFIASDSKHIETLVSLLQYPNWQCQLTNLMVGGIYWMDSQLAGELISAINGLTTLQLLALDWFANTEIPDLSILAQLKTVVFQSDRLSAFLHSLERNATDNTDLEVHLLSRDSEALLSLSQPLQSRIVRFGRDPFYTIDQVPILCSQFLSLTSLSVWPIKPTEVGRLFSDLSQLHQLIHLSFGVYFSEKEEEKLPPLLARGLAQLNSLRALELRLCIASNSQIEWLNLPRMMPNLKTIYINYFRCVSCKVELVGNSGDSSFLSSSPALGCFRSFLFNLHPGVPLKRIILSSGKELQSAEKLLLLNQ